MSKKTKKLILSIIFIVINVIVVAIIAKRSFHNETEMYFPQMFKIWIKHWPYLLVVFILPLIALIAEGFKYVIMIYHTTGKIRIRLSMKTAALGKYYDNITPLATGGQPFQVYYLYKNDVPSDAAASMPISAFAMMQFAFLIASLIVFFFFGNVIEINALRIAAYIGAFFSVFLPFVVIMFSLLPKISTRIAFGTLKFLHKLGLVANPQDKLTHIEEYLINFKNSMKFIGSSFKTMLPTIILSFIYQAAIFSIPYFAIRASGVQISYIEVTAMCVFVYAAIAFFPTPGNSAAAEISFTLIFTILSGGMLFWTMLLWRVGSYFFVIFVGLSTLFYDFIKARLIKNDDIAEDES